MDILQGYDKVHSWIDNDVAAERMTEEMLDNNVNVVDHRYKFDGYKDLNEFLCGTCDI